MTRLDDLDATTTALEASFEGIRTIMGGLADRAAAAEVTRDAAIAANTESEADRARYNAIVDRLIDLAHKAHDIINKPV